MRQTTLEKTLARLNAVSDLTVQYDEPRGVIEVRKGKRGYAWSIVFSETGRFCYGYRLDIRPELTTTVRSLTEILKTLGAVRTS